MLSKFILNTSFHQLLMDIDNDLADETQKKGCPYCSGTLHRAAYPRSPFGLPQILRFLYQSRLSFCCARCRKRTTPPSVRFFGRRLFVGWIIILISALNKAPTENRCAAINKHLGIKISESTWKRWRQWWKHLFPTTQFWQSLKGLIPPAARQGPYPRVFFPIKKGAWQDKISFVLNFLSPLTAGIFRAV